MLNCKTLKGNKYFYQSSSPFLSSPCSLMSTVDSHSAVWGCWSVPPPPVVSLQLTVSLLNYHPPPHPPPQLPCNKSPNIPSCEAPQLYIHYVPGSTALHSAKCCLSSVQSTLLLFFFSRPTNRVLKRISTSWQGHIFLN